MAFVGGIVFSADILFTLFVSFVPSW
jgi:hypothetical protein